MDRFRLVEPVDSCEKNDKSAKKGGKLIFLKKNLAKPQNMCYFLHRKKFKHKRTNYED